MPVKATPSEGTYETSFCDINIGGYEITFCKTITKQPDSVRIRSINGNKNGKIILDADIYSSYIVDVDYVTGVTNVEHVTGKEKLVVFHPEKSSIPGDVNVSNL